MLPTFVIDFDSTFITLESLDELATLTLSRHPKQTELLRKIVALTSAGMEGTIDFPTSLARRLTLFQPTKKDITRLVTLLKKNITPSILRNKAFFQKNSEHIYIISGGFKEYIAPIVKSFGITPSHIFANTFTYDKKGRVTGFDSQNPLSQKNGKVKAVEALEKKGMICVIGDGITDYQIKEQGMADVFFAFSENVTREKAFLGADKTISTFEELLTHFALPHATRPEQTKRKN